MKFRVTNLGVWGTAQPCDDAVIAREGDWAEWQIEIVSLDALLAFCQKYGPVTVTPPYDGPDAEARHPWAIEILDEKI
jgi:hypothetical protein